MDGLPETLITLFAAVLVDSGVDVLTVGVMVLAGFFWLLRIKREVQQQFKNNLWTAIKSLFKGRNKYGEK
jgi:hypothetical protein